MADTREPSPRSGRVFKRGKVEKDKKDKTKSPGQQLEDSGDFIDDGTLDQQGNPNKYRDALKITRDTGLALVGGTAAVLRQLFINPLLRGGM